MSPPSSCAKITTYLAALGGYDPNQMDEETIVEFANELLGHLKVMSHRREKVLTEPQMQYKAAKYLSKHKYAFLVCSSTNVDSLTSFYQAAQMAAYPGKRYMYVYSPYVLEQLRLYSKTAGAFSEVYRFEHTDVRYYKDITHF